VATVSCKTTSERFEFIARNREIGITYLYEWLGVSISGYYAWLKRSESKRAKADRELGLLITRIHRESGGTYGSTRVFEALKDLGICISKKRVEQLMSELCLEGRVVRVTRRQPGLKRFKEAGENLRLDAPEVDGLNQQWVADVTYLKLNGVWLYLAVVMDVYSRRILGWSMARHRTTELTHLLH
jgi:transposase InsO family protein